MAAGGESETSPLLARDGAAGRLQREQGASYTEEKVPIMPQQDVAEGEGTRPLSSVDASAEEGGLQDGPRGSRLTVCLRKIYSFLSTYTLLVLGVFVCFLLIADLDGGMYSFASVFQTRLIKVSRREVELMGSLQVGFSAFVAPLAARLTTWIGPKWGPGLTCLLGSVLAVGGWVSSSYSKLHGTPCLYAGQIVSGMGYGCMYVPPIMAINEALDKGRDITMGFALSGAGMGQVFVGVLLNNVVPLHGWENTFRFILSGICGGCGLLGLLLLPKPRPKPKAGAAGHGDAPPPSLKDVTCESDGQVAVEQPQEASCGQKLMGLPKFLLVLYLGPQVVALSNLKNYRSFLWFCLGDCLAVAGLYLPYACMPQLVDIEGAADSVPVWLVVLGLSSTFGRIGSGLFCGYFKDTSPLVSLQLTPCCLLVAGLCPWLLPITYTHSQPVFYFLCLLIGLFTGGWIAATPSLIIGLLGEKDLGAAFGGLTVVRGLVACIAPPLLGQFASPYPFVFSSFSFITASIVFWGTGLSYKPIPAQSVDDIS